MARKSTGGIVEKQTRRGLSFGIRFRALGRRQFVHVGHAADGVSRDDAARELAYTLEQVRRGEWSAPAEPEPVREVPTLHEFASEWLADKQHELRETTIATYRWELTHHLLPFFARKRLDAITVEDVDAYRRGKVRESEKRRAAIAAGEPLTTPDGRVLRPLAASSINRQITRLGQILDVGQERGWLVQNPVRVNPRNRKLKAGKPSRPSLEPWQTEVLLTAAGELDRENPRALPIRRPLLATLAYSGLRIGELIELRWRSVDLAGGTITVEASKTEAGEREIDLQPELRDELIAWRQRSPFVGIHDHVFPTRGGKPQNRHNVRRRFVLKAAERADERLAAEGRPLLPEGLSPHALRRSFASWLIYEGEDPAYVQAQLGHEDSSMTMDVYVKAVRTGRRTVRARRRLEQDGAPTGTRDVEAMFAALDVEAA